MEHLWQFRRWHVFGLMPWHYGVYHWHYNIGDVGVGPQSHHHDKWLGVDIQVHLVCGKPETAEAPCQPHEDNGWLITYATLFGIADKVSDSFSRVYPDYFKMNQMAGTRLSIVGNRSLVRYANAAVEGSRQAEQQPVTTQHPLRSSGFVIPMYII